MNKPSIFGIRVNNNLPQQLTYSYDEALIDKKIMENYFRVVKQKAKIKIVELTLTISTIKTGRKLK